MVRVHVGEPFWSTSGLAEEAVLKTVAPAKVSRVQIPGAPRFHPCSSIDQSRLLLRDRCERESRRGYQGPHGAKAACLVLSQKTSEHYRVRAPVSSLCSSKAEPPVDNWETEERYLAEGPFGCLAERD